MAWSYVCINGLVICVHLWLGHMCALMAWSYVCINGLVICVH